MKKFLIICAVGVGLIIILLSIAIYSNLRRMTAQTQCVWIHTYLVNEIRGGRVSNEKDAAKVLSNLKIGRGDLLRRNSKGELVDTWNHPIDIKVHFSLLIDVEVRSAGRDGSLGTSDDICLRSSFPKSEIGSPPVNGSVHEMAN